jgi:integral membrane protein (TIGR01906 family)
VAGAEQLDLKLLAGGVAAALAVIAVPLLIFTTNTLALFFDAGFYSQGEVEQQVDLVYGLPQRVLVPVNEAIVRYFGSNETLPDSLAAEGADRAFFNERELKHMEDVRGWVRLLGSAQRVSLVYGIIFVAASLLLLRTGAVGRIGVCLVAGGVLAIAVVLLVGVIAMVDFADFWTRVFHPLFFSNDFWLLDPRTDHLIQMVPFGFWRNTAITLVLRSMLTTVGVIFVGGCLVWLGRRLL